MANRKEKMNTEHGFMDISKRGTTISKTKKGKATATLSPSASQVSAKATAKQTNEVYQETEKEVDDARASDDSDDGMDLPNEFRLLHKDSLYRGPRQLNVDNGEGPSTRKPLARKVATPNKAQRTPHPTSQGAQEEHGGEDESDEEVHSPKTRSQMKNTSSTPPNIPTQQSTPSNENRRSKRLRERKEQEAHNSEDDADETAAPAPKRVQTPKKSQRAKKEGYLGNGFWEVKEIHNHRWRKDIGKYVFEYFIEWKGEEHKGKDSWQLEKNVTKMAIDEYWKEKGEKKPRKPKR